MIALTENGYKKAEEIAEGFQKLDEKNMCGVKRRRERDFADTSSQSRKRTGKVMVFPV